MPGPLNGIKVVEIAGIGPGPFCAMVLADLGADVLRVDRPASRKASFGGVTALERGRRSVSIDLKHPDGVEAVLKLVEKADVLTEGFRPGVAERLGIGPGDCLARNERLIYGRMTGWGQDGPMAHAAGHDINYIALAGVLEAIGPSGGGAPAIPLNLIGDFGGGGMLLAMGIMAALVERAASGKGQVVDAAMVDGAALLATSFAAGRGAGERGTGLLGGGAHFYNVYECSDGRYVSIGSIEPQFYAELVRLLELDASDLPSQMDGSQWPVLREKLAGIFKTKTRDEWCALMEGTDVCFAPVLTMQEAKEHPHNVARGTFVEVGGSLQPGPAPRFSRTPGQVSRPPAKPGEHTDEALADWGFNESDLEKLRTAGAIG